MAVNYIEDNRQGCGGCEKATKWENDISIRYRFVGFDWQKNRSKGGQKRP
jgi:hypothetical protein